MVDVHVGVDNQGQMNLTHGNKRVESLFFVRFDHTRVDYDTFLCVGVVDDVCVFGKWIEGE